ncbi:MAG TPA: hypothetical protein VII94_02720 [Candidatus Saccharimonadales bacterium]
MQKNAQRQTRRSLYNRETKRNPFNQLREKLNAPSKALEGYFTPELNRVMENLVEIDDQIRSELSGTKVGDHGDTPSDNFSAKDLLKNARTNFNQREYIMGVSELGRFHKKMANVVTLLNKLDLEVNLIHSKFLFEGVDEDKIKELRQYMGANSKYKLVKEAGIMDFFHNTFSTRGRSLAAWEKKYPKETKAIRDGGPKLVESAFNLLAITISALKEMATARAVRRPDDYINAAAKIKSEYAKFDSGPKGFRAYYKDAIAPFMAIKDQIENGKTPPATEVGGAVPVTTVVTPAQAPEVSIPIHEQPMEDNRELAESPTVNIGGGATPAPPKHDTIPDPNTKPKKADDGVFAHRKFYESLEAMSQEDPCILAKFISKYASSIQSKDTETAIKLFALVKQIKA